MQGGYPKIERHRDQPSLGWDCVHVRVPKRKVVHGPHDSPYAMFQEVITTRATASSTPKLYVDICRGDVLIV